MRTPSYLAPSAISSSAPCAVFQVMKSIFQFDGFHLHFISLFLEKIPFVHHFACRLVFIIPLPTSCGGPRIWFSLGFWHISHPLSEQFTLRDSPSVSPAPTYKYFAFSNFPYFLLISSTQSSLTFSDSSDVPLFLSPVVWLVGIPQKLWQLLSQNLPRHSLLTVSLTFTCILAACVFLLLKRKKKGEKYKY